MEEREFVESKSDDEIIELLSQGENKVEGARFDAIKNEGYRRGLVTKYKQTKFLVEEIDGKQTGPHDVPEVKQLFLNGLLNKDSMVYIESIDSWTSIALVFDYALWQRPLESLKNFQNDSRTPEGETEPGVDSPIVHRSEALATDSQEKSNVVTDMSESLPYVISNDASDESRANNRLTNSNTMSPSESNVSKVNEMNERSASVGLGRGLYATIAIPLYIFGNLAYLASGPSSPGLFPLMFIIATVLIVATAFRLKNIGSSVGWICLMFVPCVSLGLLIYCLFAQTGSNSRQITSIR